MESVIYSQGKSAIFVGQSMINPTNINKLESTKHGIADDHVCILHVKEDSTSASYRLDELSVLPLGAHKLYTKHSNHSEIVDDLSKLVIRLVRSLRKSAPDNDLSEKALDYLKRNGLLGSPLRGDE